VRPRPILLALLSLAVAVVPAVPAGSDPVTQPACSGDHPTRDFVTGKGVLENLLFDGRGSLYVTGNSMLRRYDRRGNEEVLVEGASLGGLAIGPDRALYVGFGNDGGSSIRHAGASAVWRVTRARPFAYTVYAEGFDMANGMTFDRRGNLYVSNDFQRAIVKIPRRNPSRWTVWADQFYSPNGLVIDPSGRYLDAALTFDQRSPIARFPLADPTRASILTSLTFGLATLEPGVEDASDPESPLVPKGLDDMTRDAKGRLYVTANGSGEVIRFDPRNGEACVLATGLRNPSSVRFAKGFGTDDGKLYVTQFGGAITVVTP
jgi:sugar lactone lactonase YvrE